MLRPNSMYVFLSENGIITENIPSFDSRFDTLCSNDEGVKEIECFAVDTRGF